LSRLPRPPFRKPSPRTLGRRRKCNRAFLVGLLQKASATLEAAVEKIAACLMCSFLTGIGTFKKASSFYIEDF
jgi:hypothetical protein